MKILRVTCCLFVLLLSLVSLAFVAVPPTAAQDLNPPPPFPGASCQTTGQGIICQGSHQGTIVNDETLISCDSFQVLQSGPGYVRYTIFYNQDGNATNSIFHERFGGTLSNSVTGASVPFKTSETYTLTFATPGDLSTATWSFMGQIYKVTLPGSGLILQADGIVVFFALQDLIFEHGPHFPPDQVQRLCAALS